MAENMIDWDGGFAPRPPRSTGALPTEPMVVYGIVRQPDGSFKQFEPYVLLPDGSMEDLILPISD